MNDDLKQFSEQLALELKAKLATPEVADFVQKAKSAGDDRTFEVVFSTSDEDRQGDSLDQSKWDLKDYVKNPILLWAHNYGGFPIGVIDDIEIQGERSIAKGHFAPVGVNPEADMACALYQAKILRAVSPGYIQHDDGTRELLEVSFCPVPAGRNALSLRQVERLGVSTRDLVSKGFFYDDSPPISISEKAQKPGDSCELEDGTPGVMAEQDGKLVCVPAEAKEIKSDESMNELEKNLTAEHERHGGEIGKAIDEFKSIDEFEKAIDSEHETHLDKCMKAIDDTYETMGREENKAHKKSIDEFKSDMEAEHLEHVKCFDKAIEEFKGALNDADGEEDQKKAIEEFTKSAGAELDRHEKAHKAMCKAEADRMGEGEEDGKTEKKGVVEDMFMQGAEDREKNERMSYVMTVMYAFCNAYYESPVESFFELIKEAISLIEEYVKHEQEESDEDEEAEGQEQKKYAGLVADFVKKGKTKAGRAISAKTKDKIEACIKAIENGHAEHGKFTDDVTAALKAIVASGDGGEETQPEKKSGEAPNSRSSTSGATAELETYLFTQRLVRQVKTASEGALRQLGDKIREIRSGR